MCVYWNLWMRTATRKEWNWMRANRLKKSKWEEQEPYGIYWNRRDNISKVWMRAKLQIKINLSTLLRSFANEFIRESHLSMRLKCHTATTIWRQAGVLHCQRVHIMFVCVYIHSTLCTLAYYFVLIWCLQCWHNVHINLCITASISG